MLSSFSVSAWGYFHKFSVVRRGAAHPGGGWPSWGSGGYARPSKRGHPACPLQSVISGFPDPLASRVPSPTASHRTCPRSPPGAVLGTGLPGKPAAPYARLPIPPGDLGHRTHAGFRLRTGHNAKLEPCRGTKRPARTPPAAGWDPRPPLPEGPDRGRTGWVSDLRPRVPRWGTRMCVSADTTC